MKTGELALCTSFPEWVHVTQDLKSQGSSSEITTVVIANDKDRNAAPWHWQESSTLSGLDRTENPLLIYGTGYYKGLGPKQFQIDKIVMENVKGVTLQNIHCQNWVLTNCDVTFIDCPGAPS